MLRKLKFPILIALLLTLAVLLCDEKLRQFGGPILLTMYAVMMTAIIYKARDGKRHV